MPRFSHILWDGGRVGEGSERTRHEFYGIENVHFFVERPPMSTINIRVYLQER